MSSLFLFKLEERNETKRTKRNETNETKRMNERMKQILTNTHFNTQTPTQMGHAKAMALRNKSQTINGRSELPLYRSKKTEKFSNVQRLIIESILSHGGVATYQTISNDCIEVRKTQK